MKIKILDKWGWGNGGQCCNFTVDGRLYRLLWASVPFIELLEQIEADDCNESFLINRYPNVYKVLTVLEPVIDANDYKTLQSELREYWIDEVCDDSNYTSVYITTEVGDLEVMLDNRGAELLAQKKVIPPYSEK